MLGFGKKHTQSSTSVERTSSSSDNATTLEQQFQHQKSSNDLKLYGTSSHKQPSSGARTMTSSHIDFDLADSSRLAQTSQSQNGENTLQAPREPPLTLTEADKVAGHLLLKILAILKRNFGSIQIKRYRFSEESLPNVLAEFKDVDKYLDYLRRKILTDPS